jgi:hypothetical protein
MPAELMALAANVSRNLSPSEWRRYFPGVEYRRTFSNLDVPDDAPQQTARIISGP